jgi:hypothetical protein
MNKALLIAVLVVFSALTAYTMMHYGGLIPWLLFYTRDPASWQIFADLLIAMCLLLVFIKRDAEATGRPLLALGDFLDHLRLLWTFAVFPHPEEKSMSAHPWTEWRVRCAFAAAGVIRLLPLSGLFGRHLLERPDGIHRSEGQAW